MTNKITLKELIQLAIDKELIDFEIGDQLNKELNNLKEDSDFLSGV